MDKIILTDVLDGLDLGNYADQFNGYRSSSGYICDIISEIADNNTSIYYYDIRNYISGHVEEVENAISEYGWDGCGCSLDKAGQLAEYEGIVADLYDHLDDAIIMLTANVLVYDMEVKEVPADTWDAILDAIGTIDSNDTIDVIPDRIREVMESEV